jgi:hypothetical protein
MLAKKGSLIHFSKISPENFTSVKPHIQNSMQNNARIQIAAKYKKLHLKENPQIIPELPRKTAVAKFQISAGEDCLAKHLY